jgi:hypothetical protein
LGFEAALAGPLPECGSPALTTPFLTAFQRFEYRDGSLGVSRPENQARLANGRMGAGKPTILRLPSLPFACSTRTGPVSVRDSGFRELAAEVLARDCGLFVLHRIAYAAGAGALVPHGRSTDYAEG